MDLILLLLQSVYFVVPAYFANMAPVIANKLQILSKVNKPIDMNKELDGKPIFGRNKTFRGFLVAVAMGIILAYIQKALIVVPFFSRISIVDYSNPLLLGSLLGSGAITGDLIKSFFKRRIGIKPGKPFIPFDQTDFVLGAYAFTLPFYRIDWQIILTSILISFVLHIIVNHSAFYLKIRKEKW